MAANNIVIGLSADSSKVSSVLKSTSKELSSFLGVDRFIKLQLDDTDFRKKYQDDIRLAREELKKLKLETYTAANGKEVRITSKNAVKARDRFIDMADQAKKSGNAALEKSYIAKANAVTQYANALYALNIVEKANATLQEKQLGLESRIQAAENTGKVNAKRRLAEAKAMKEALAEVNAEDIKRVSSQITQAQNRLSNARHMKDEVESLRGQIAANRELNKLYRQRAKLSGIDSDKDIALSYGRANQVANEELQRIKSNERVRKEQEAYNKAVFEADSKRRRQKAQEERQATKEQEAFDKAVFNDRSKRMRKQQAEEARIAREREKAQKAVNRTESRISELNRTNRLRGGNDTGTISRLIQQYDKLAISARKAGDAQKAASAEANSSRLRRQYEALTALNGGYEKQHGILSKLKSIASRYFSIFTVIDVAKKIAETTGYFQQQQVALEGILGSATKAQKVLTDIKAFALQSPFQTKELVNFTKQLSAFGISSEELFPRVKELADISAGLGVDMSRIILAYGQVKSASVLRGQELRQFTEAGIPMVQALADKFTMLNKTVVTTGDVFKLISDRKVPFEMVASVLSDMAAEGGKFYKMQENITNTMYGQIQKLKDIWTLSLDEMGRSVDGLLISVIKKLQDILRNAKSVAAGILIAFATIKLQTFISSLQKIPALFRSMSFVGGAAGAILGFTISKIVEMRTEANKFKKKIAEIKTSFEKDTIKMSTGLDSLTKKIQKMNIGTKEWSDTIGTLAANYGNFLNTDIISALQEQGNEAMKVAMEFDKIAESIKLAIKAYNEYMAAVQISEVSMTTLNSRLDNYEGKDGKGIFGAKYLKESAKKTFGDDRADEIFRSVKDYYAIARNEFATDKTNRTREQFNNIFERVLKENIPEFKKEESKRLLENIISHGWYNFGGTNEFKSYINSLGAAENTDYYNIRKYFNNIDTGQIRTGRDAIERGKLVSVEYNNALLNTLGDQFGERIQYLQEEVDAGRELNDAQKKFLEDYIDLYNEIEKASNVETFDNNSIANINKKYKVFLDNLAMLPDEILNKEDIKGFSTLMEERNIASQILSVYQEFAKQKTGHAARISNNFDNPINDLYRYREDQDLQAIIAIYSQVTDENYENLREQLQSDKSKATTKLQNLISGPYHEADKKLLEKQIKLYDILQRDENFGIGDKKYGRSGGSKGNWAQFLNGFIDLIKTASNSEKQLVEGVDGYTTKLYEDIDKLEDSPLKDFYNAGTNPFEKYLQTIKDYDLEGFFTKEDFDKLTTKFLEGVGPDNINAADYRTIWKDLIQIMSNKVNTTANAADKERLKSVLRNMEKEFETFFGKQEISALIEKNLKELTNINSSIKTIERKNDIFNRISASGGLVSAQSAMYGGANYSSYNFVKTVSDKLSRYVGADAFGGFASTLVGSTLKKISDEGQFGLQHIVTLLNALEELAKTTKSGNVTDRAGNLVAASEEFKSIVPEISSLIEEMIEAILKEYEKLREANPNYINQNNDISNAYSRFIDRNNTARTLDEPLRDRALAESSQKFFSDIAKIMNGPDLANWIKDLFANVGSTNGTRGGIWAQAFLGGSSLMDIITMAKMNKLEGIARNEGQQAFEEKLKISTEKLNKFSSSMIMVNAILSSIDNVLHGTIEAMRKYLDMLDSQNKLTTDEYGNYTKTYDTTKSRMQLDAADQFLNDFIPIKSLMSGDITGVLNFIPNTIMGLIESINKIKDQGKQDEQDELISSNKALEKAMGDLTFALEDAAGKDKFDNKYQQIANLQQQQLNYESLLALEESKKSGDADKAEEYRQAADDAKKQQESMLREIQNEILGTADEIAATLTDAFVEAFRNGTNAAREWRDSVKSYISDILKEQLLQNVFAPEIQKAISDFGINEGMSSDAIISLLKDPEAVGNLESEMFRIGDKMNDTLNSLDPRIQAWIGYKSSDTALSGGIESITEDTARRLEALQNSQLGEIVMLRLNSDILVQESYSMSSSLKSMVGSAQRIDANTLAIRTAIDEMRIGTRPLNVSIV